MTNHSHNSQVKILVTEPQEITQEAIHLLEAEGYEVITSLELGEEKDIQGLFIRTYTKATSEYLAQFPKLKFILRAGVGMDNIDLAECKARDIQVFNAPGSNADAVAEYILAMMLVTLRKIPQQIKQVERHEWRDLQNIGTDLRGKTVGLVGCGAIGKSLAAKLESFGVSLLGYDPFLDSVTLQQNGITKSSLQELLQQSDLISLHLPLLPETRGMFGSDEFRQMKPDAILINVSRGELVSETDLASALRDSTIGGAVLDVVCNEPQINTELLVVPNLIITPHIAGFSKEASIKMAVGAVENFLKKYSDSQSVQHAFL